jgi:hypothetical protein
MYNNSRNLHFRQYLFSNLLTYSFVYSQIFHLFIYL